MVKDGTYASMEAGKVLGMTGLENLSDEVKEIMKRQPLNPFVKTEVRVMPLYYPPVPGTLQGKGKGVTDSSTGQLRGK